MYGHYRLLLPRLRGALLIFFAIRRWKSACMAVVWAHSLRSWFSVRCLYDLSWFNYWYLTSYAVFFQANRTLENVDVVTDEAPSFAIWSFTNERIFCLSLSLFERLWLMLFIYLRGNKLVKYGNWIKNFCFFCKVENLTDFISLSRIVISQL